MAKSRLTFTLDPDVLAEIDRLVEAGVFLNRSQAVREAVEEKLRSLGGARATGGDPVPAAHAVKPVAAGSRARDKGKSSGFRSVLQFRVQLRDIEPPIWRRIQVPETYTFWDLHVAIQDAMGWRDYHLHEFRIRNPATGGEHRIGIPDEDELFNPEVETGWDLPVVFYLTRDNPRAEYEYDFGDSWIHDVVLEDVLPKGKGAKYPLCLEGGRKCPPEDCGGAPGYDDFLEAIMDPRHGEHAEMLVWAGGDFHPEEFDPQQVRFDDPKQRWKRAFTEPPD
jgi:hypothetical protein